MLVTDIALANELEKMLLNKQKKQNRANKNIKRRLNNASIKNDLIKLYGKKWMNKYGNVMNLNKNVREVKNKLTKRLLPVKIIEGSISEGDTIFNKDTEISESSGVYKFFNSQIFFKTIVSL